MNFTSHFHKNLRLQDSKVLLPFLHFQYLRLIFQYREKCKVTGKTATSSYDESDYEQPKQVVKLNKWEPQHVKKELKI